MSLAFIAVLLCAISGASAQVFVGTLPTHFHEFAGELYIVDADTFLIVNISYDGRGPDAFPYYFTTEFAGSKERSVLEIGGGVIIGEQFSSEALDGTTNATFDLPSYVRTCDIGVLGVWCRYAQQLFTTIPINQSLFTTDTNDNMGRIFCEQSPGIYIGALSADDGVDTISGTLYIVDNRTALVDGLIFDATQQTAVSVYWFGAEVTPMPDGTGGTMISLSGTGGILPAMNYNMASLMLPFGTDYSCDMAGGTLVFATSTTILAYIMVPRFQNTVPPVVVPYYVFLNNPLISSYYGRGVLCIDRLATRIGVYVGQMQPLTATTTAFDDHRLNRDTTVYALNNNTLHFQLFNYDGSGEETYFRFWPRDSTVEDSGEGGTNLRLDATQAQFPSGLDNSFSFADVYLNLRDTPGVEESLCDIGTIAIWGQEMGDTSTRVFGLIEIPENIFTDDYDEAVSNDDLIFCTIAGAPPTAAMVTLVTILAFAVSALLFQA